MSTEEARATQSTGASRPFAAPGSVFLSYASEDTAAAERIATALRIGGIEVWFDKNELRGGDAWDRQIRRQIRDCTLFVPVISANTQARHEGYFRLEWDLADQRTHLMGRNRAFIMPVCTDATPEREADVPDSFLTVQWTRLSEGETSPTFVSRVQRLLSGGAPPSGRVTVGVREIEPTPISRWMKRALLAAIAVVIFGAVAYLAIVRRGIFTPAASVAFAPPPYSIAVLPFVNMSGSKEQEYFSDGLTEEILNSLARINELQVSARTSSFFFKGKDVDLGAIAHKLNVASVLEGSVRRAGDTVRITAQLDNAATGFHLWSQTYDRNLSNVLQVQTEIANAVASALKIRLLGDVAARIEQGGTSNPAAFDAYLRAQNAYNAQHGVQDAQRAIAEYSQAIELDPSYALAFVGRSEALRRIAVNKETAAPLRETYEKAREDAQKAIALAPDLPEGHIALGGYLWSGLLDFTQANEQYERAMALAPGNAHVLADYALFAVLMDHKEAAIAAARRAASLDPLNRRAQAIVGFVLFYARQYDQAIAAYQASVALDPNVAEPYARRGLAYYMLGQLQSARQSCEAKPNDWYPQSCLAIIYDKLGRHADAEAMLAKLKASGDYRHVSAEIYAQWGNVPKALELLESTLQQRDAGLAWLKVDPLLDPLRQEPRFQEIVRALKFPD